MTLNEYLEQADALSNLKKNFAPSDELILDLKLPDSESEQFAAAQTQAIIGLAVEQAAANKLQQEQNMLLEKLVYAVQKFVAQGE